MDSEDLRLAVYRAFAGTGRAPEPGELAGQLGADAQEVAAGRKGPYGVATWAGARPRGGGRG